MTSINYELTDSGVKLSETSGEYLGTIYLNTEKSMTTQHKDYKKWVVCLSSLGIEAVSFNNLEAAKYYALAMYLEYRC